MSDGEGLGGNRTRSGMQRNIDDCGNRQEALPGEKRHTISPNVSVIYYGKSRLVGLVRARFRVNLGRLPQRHIRQNLMNCLPNDAFRNEYPIFNTDLVYNKCQAWLISVNNARRYNCSRNDGLRGCLSSRAEAPGTACGLIEIRGFSQPRGSDRGDHKLGNPHAARDRKRFGAQIDQ